MVPEQSGDLAVQIGELLLLLSGWDVALEIALKIVVRRFLQPFQGGGLLGALGNRVGAWAVTTGVSFTSAKKAARL